MNFIQQLKSCLHVYIIKQEKKQIKLHIQKSIRILTDREIIIGLSIAGQINI